VVLRMAGGEDLPKDPAGPFSFEKEHGNMEDKLNDLRSLLVKYLDPNYDDNDFNEFMISLFQFEKDVIDHSRIEDHILVPQLEAFNRD